MRWCTERGPRMNVDDIGLDGRIVRMLKEDGIEHLYPPQEAAIGPALSGENLVLAIPTASGKSLVAYLAILKAVLRGGKALYIVPLKALASEKFEDLSGFEKLGIRVGESTGDYDQIDAKLGKYDVVVATSEKADSLLRHRAKWLEQLSVVVADEIHLINDPDRGPTLEVLLVKFRAFNERAQLIALSATIRNARELADWLGARLIESDWRPVPLKEGVYCEGRLSFTDNTRRTLPEDESPAHSVVRDALSSGGQCLVFVNTRKSSESLASDLTRLTKTYRNDMSEDLLMLSKRLVAEQEEPTSLGNRLARCIKNGCAFHHAGLTAAQRKLVETSFKRGLLACIVATPTLAAGINLPARTVVVRDVRRFDANTGPAAIPILEVKQMCGRAGRPRFDKYGEAILIARNEEEREGLFDTYLLGENENIYSKLGTEPAMRSHVLSLIATKDASCIEDLDGFFSKTFLAQQTDVSYLRDTIESIVDFLRDEGMIRDDEALRTTHFGKRVSDLYIDPKSAVIMRDALTKYVPGRTFGVLHTICAVPNMTQFYLRRSDYEWVEDHASERSNQMLLEPPLDLARYELFLSEVKTARMLEDWISEVHENEIAKTFGIGPGDIRNKVESAEWLAHAMASLAELFKKDAVEDLRLIRTRIRYGIKHELLDLVKLKGVGRVRARALHDRSFRTLEDLRLASYDRLKQVPLIGEAVAHSIKNQLGQMPPVIPEATDERQKSLKDYR